MEDINEAGSGDIFALFGVDCASGESFCDSDVKFKMTEMFVPDPVISLSIVPASKTKDQASFSKVPAIVGVGLLLKGCQLVNTLTCHTYYLVIYPST